MTDTAPAATAPSVEDVRRYARLRRTQREAQAKANAAKKEADRLQQTLRTQFAQAGLQNMTVDGSTVYLSRQLWAFPASGEAEALHAALREHGHGHIIKEQVNAQTLSAIYRESLEDPDDPESSTLPEAIRDHLTIDERFTLGVRAT